MSGAPCPKCSRLNAPHRVGCLYCGAPMPAPQAPPPKEERALPPNLDDLVRRALQGRGGLEKVRTALSGAEPPPDQPGKPRPPAEIPEMIKPLIKPVISPVIAPAAVNLAPVTAPAPAPVTQTAPDLEALWARLVAEAAAARQAQPSDTDAALAGLDRAEALIGELRRALSAVRAPAPEPERRRLRLPPIRLPWMLVAGADATAEQLMAGAGLDAITARGLAGAGWPRVVRRGERAALAEWEARAAGAGLAVRLLCRADLEEAAGWAVLGGAGRGPEAAWRLSGEPLWEEPPEPDSVPEERRTPVDFGAILQAVPGEVSSTSRRGGAVSGRWDRQRLAAGGPQAERRVAVLDLHLRGSILRIVEDMTAFGALPGHDPSSARLSLKGLTGVLSSLGVPVLPKRVCAAGAQTVSEGGAQSGSGWPGWEEHSRICYVMNFMDEPAGGQR